MFSKCVNCCTLSTKLLSTLALRKGRRISTELTTALRPFYFAVHPDLFCQHPEERKVNENSLKQLAAHMELLNERKFNLLRETKTLQFYIRDGSTTDRSNLKMVAITLDKKIRDPKTLIQRLLEICNLSTDYIKTVKIVPNVRLIGLENITGFNHDQDLGKDADPTGFESNYTTTKEVYQKTLSSWIVENSILAKQRSKELAGLKEEVTKLQTSVVEQMELEDVRYDCGWNYEHYRGCLKTLNRMAKLHEKHMHVLKNRVVVFAPFTGVSLEGHIMLYTGDVMSSWLDFIKIIPRQDEFLLKVPFYEKALSQVLRHIKIAHRKFTPKQQAVEYAGHLLKVTTTIGDYLTHSKFPKSWPKSLSEYEIVIESEAGPLMVNPTGQLIAPSTCPGFMLVDFITTNLELAMERMNKYKEQKHVENALMEECIKKFKLKSLSKDDSVTPDKMIDALNKLVTYDESEFENIDLHITNYYSVLTDGTVCIPWDYYMSR